MGIVAEEWRPVAGFYEGWKYLVSNRGRVASVHRGWQLMTIRKSPDGYLFTDVKHGDVRTTARVNRLVAMAFVDGYQSGLEANHKNGNKLDNSPDNLEWVTTQENIAHAFRMNLRTGPGVYRRKMSITDACAIRELLSRGVTQTFLARWFGVAQGSISAIHRGITYQT